MDKKLLILRYFLIIIITALLGYLIYVNYNENKTLESFMTRNSLSTYFNSDDDSIMDNKFFRNELKQTRNFLDYTPSEWNGSYKFFDANMDEHYITFLQINKDLLFIMNKKRFTISGNDPDPYIMKDKYAKNKKQCLPEMVIGRGELNFNNKMFHLKHVYCSSNDNGDGDYAPFNKSEPINSESINLFYGFIQDQDGLIKIVQLKDNGSGEVGHAILEKESNFKYGPSAEYLLRSSYNVPAPNYRNSLRLNPDVCYNSYFQNKDGKDYRKTELKKCYITDVGMPTPADKDTEFNQNNQVYQYNDYSTGCVDNTENLQEFTKTNGEKWYKCPLNDTGKTCYIPIKDKSGQSQLETLGEYPKCDTSYDINVVNQSSLSYPFLKKEDDSGNILDLCNHLEGFQSKKYNSAILMYVDNLSMVHSLHYDFFGMEQGQNYLNTKLDIMFPFMNENVLNSYRNNINEESLKLTNCIENNNSIKNYQDIISSCNGKYQQADQEYEKIKEKIEKSKKSESNFKLKEMYNIMAGINSDINYKESNKLLQPTVWTLSFVENENEQKNLPDYTNDCSFILSTNNKYNKEGRFIKYAEFDSFHNKTKMSLYKGGNKQKLVLENPYVINSLEKLMGTEEYNKTGPNTDNNISDDFILLSGNLKTYHPKKYLLPGQGQQMDTNFGKELYLSNDINPNGKWVMLGFNLTNNLDVANSPSLYNSTLVKTLKKISNKINE